MTSAHLRPCPSCSRHARVSEAACPFCGAAFAEAFRASPRPKGPSARLTRAALVAFGALGTGSLAVLPACSSSSSAAPTAAGDTDDSGVTVGPFYGAAPIEADAAPGTKDAGTGVTTDAEGDDASASPDGGPRCTPTTCAALGYTSGFARDGCGGVLDCRSFNVNAHDSPVPVYGAPPPSRRPGRRP